MGRIAQTVFVDRSMTLSEAAEEYEIDDLIGTIRAVRRMLRSTLETLPDAAFAAQPAAEGEAAWSAGQVVAHLANAQASMSGQVRDLLGMQASADGRTYDMTNLPTREDAIAILDDANPGFDTFVAAIPADADLLKSMTHARFGEMNGKGWMLLMALHEADHLRQVRALAE